MPGTDPAGTAAARAREQRGWYFYDWANSAFSTTVVTVFLGPYLITLAEDAADPNGRVSFVFWQVRPASYFSWVVSLSVVVQVLVLPVMGAIADRSRHKKQILAAFAFLGATATMAMFFLEAARYQLGALLLVVANVAFGVSVVVYNAFLPQIASPDERDRVSSRGWALGYLGGAILLTLNLALFLGHESVGLTEGEAVRLSLLSAGVWWALFTLIPLARLRNREPPNPVRGNIVRAGFRQLGETLAQVRQFPQTLRFLVAYLLYNDGIQTVIALAAVYIEKELLLDTSVSVAVILLVQFVAFVGALALGRLAGRLGAQRVILLSLVIWVGVLVAAFVLPAGAPAPLFALAAVIGFVLGGSQALSRSLFSQLVPRSREAEYFSFYEISERGTSWLGTAAFGVAFELSGSYRVAIVILVGFFLVGGLVLATVRVREAVVSVGNKPPKVT